MRNLVALTAAALALIVATSAGAQERIGFGYSHLSDGNCGVAQRTMTGDYGLTSETLVLRGSVRTEPAGGDCRLGMFSYDVRIARHFRVAAGFDATVEFAAAEQSTAAPYVLADDRGQTLLRADGGALHAVHLPAGSAQTLTAAVGVSRRMGPARLGVFVNLAPIDWANDAAGRTVRLSWDTGWRGAYLETVVDAGADHFGAISTGYRHALADSKIDVGIGVTHRWGLAAIDNGAPPMQHIDRSLFMRDGPPQDHSTIFAVTVGYSISG